MTRPEKISKRKAFNKAVRARAAQEQTSFVSVLQRTQDAQHKRSFRAMLNQPTHAGRPERRNKLQIQDKPYDSELYEERECDCQNSNAESVEAETRTTIVVELMAMAKPAKVKGVAKEFEIVKRVRDVIALEDSISDLELGHDEWEEIEYDLDVMEKRTYSAALSGR